MAPRRAAAPLRWRLHLAGRRRADGICAGRLSTHGLHAGQLHAHHSASMGTLMKKMRTVGQVSLSALEDEWQRQATTAAIEAARGVVKLDGPIPPGTPIGRLSDTEWGWIVAAILFGWISTRAHQAAAEQ